MGCINSVYRWLILLVAFVSTSCVDETFRIDEVSMEVTIAQDTTTLPLGDLERMTLGDLMDKAEGIDTLLTNKDGHYVLGVSDGGAYTIEGIEHVVEIPAIDSKFAVEYPEFALTDHVEAVDEYYDIVPTLGGEVIPTGTVIPIIEGYEIKGVAEDSLTERFEYDVPTMISGLKRIYLKPTEEGDPGARIDVRFLLNDLGQINGGGHVTLELKAPEGCDLYDGNGNLVENGEFAIAEYDFTSDQNELPFLAYVKSVGNDKSVENGVIEFSFDLEYHLSFTMITKEGSLTLNQGPQLHVVTDLAYEDADIVLNEVALLDHMHPTGGDMQINDLPEQIKSIHALTFAEESPLVLHAGGFDWMSEDLAEKVVVDAWLPDYIILHDDIKIGYSAEEHKLHTTLNSLRHGIEVDLDALDFGSDGLGVDDGTMTISFAPEIDARIAAGTEVRLSSIMHEGEMTLSAGIEAAELDIQCVSGRVYFDYQYNRMVDLNVDALDGLSINGVGLTPVLILSLDNPFTLDLMASFNIVPYLNGEMLADRAVNTNSYDGVGYVTIKAAEVEAGVVKPTTTKIVLGTERSREDYTSPEYTFVPCDLDKLLSGNLPDQLDIRFNIENNPDPTVETVLYAADDYTINYEYALELPIALNKDTSITYERTIDLGSMEGGNPMEKLAEYDSIKVGDVAVIAEVTTTLPLELLAYVEMLDAEGEVIDDLAILPEGDNAIIGSKDGVTASCGALRVELNLADDGRISQLSTVAGIRLRLEAQGVAEDDVELRDEQYIEAALKIELSGGVTADLEELGLF